MEKLTEEQCKLITDNIDSMNKIVNYMYKKNKIKSLTYDDILSAAYSGIIQAAIKYNPNNCSNASFKTFSNNRIKGNILDLYREAKKNYIFNEKGEIIKSKVESIYYIDELKIDNLNSEDVLNKILSDINFEEILNILTEEEKEVFKLYSLGYSTNKIISEKLGFSPSKASKLKKRIRNKIIEYRKGAK